MPLVTLDDRVEFPEDVIAQQVGEEMVLLDLEAGVYYGLDPVGRRIWELLTEHRRLRVVFETMVEEYDVTPEALQQDLLQLVQELQARGLTQVVGT
jgi:hypothetical protein